MMDSPHTFRFTILARYPAHIPGNESQVTVNMAAGDGAHPVHSGTITMTEGQWETFVQALRDSLGDAVEVEDHATPPPP